MSLCQNKKEEEEDDVKEESSDENDNNVIDNPVAKKIGRTKKNKTRIPINVIVKDDEDDDEEPYHAKKSEENVNIIKINEKEGKKEDNKGKEDED